MRVDVIWTGNRRLCVASFLPLGRSSPRRNRPITPKTMHIQYNAWRTSSSGRKQRSSKGHCTGALVFHYHLPRKKQGRQDLGLRSVSGCPTGMTKWSCPFFISGLWNLIRQAFRGVRRDSFCFIAASPVHSYHLNGACMTPHALPHSCLRSSCVTPNRTHTPICVISKVIFCGTQC